MVGIHLLRLLGHKITNAACQLSICIDQTVWHTLHECSHHIRSKITWNISSTRLTGVRTLLSFLKHSTALIWWSQTDLAWQFQHLILRSRGTQDFPRTPAGIISARAKPRWYPCTLRWCLAVSHWCRFFAKSTASMPDVQAHNSSDFSTRAEERT